MKITIDTKNNSIKIEEPVTLGELLDFMEGFEPNVHEIRKYILDLTTIVVDYTPPQPYYPNSPSTIPYVYPWMITYNGEPTCTTGYAHTKPLEGAIKVIDPTITLDPVSELKSRNG